MVFRNENDHRPAQGEPGTAFREDLHNLYKVPFEVPPEIDEAVLTAGRRQLIRQRRMRLILQGSGMAALVCAKAVLDWLWCLGHDRADCTAFAGAGCGSHRVDAFDWQGFVKSGCFWGRTERRMTGNKGGSLG